MKCWWVLVDFDKSKWFEYCQICGEKNPGLLYGGRSCKSCMYFFRRVTYEEITFFCSAPDRKGHCVEQTDCIKCRRSCRSCRFKVISYHKNCIFLLFRHAKTLEWRLKNTLRSVIIFFWENCHQQVIFSYLYQLDTIKSSKMICDNFKKNLENECVQFIPV